MSFQLSKDDPFLKGIIERRLCALGNPYNPFSCGRGLDSMLLTRILGSSPFGGESPSITGRDSSENG